MAASRRSRAGATLIAVVVLLGGAAARPARGEVGAQIEPGYASGSTTTRDETGLETHSESEQWVQRYRLSMDNQLYPLLHFSGGGDLRWITASAMPDEGPRSESDNRAWAAHARLSAGDALLNGGLDYSRRWSEGESRRAGVTTDLPGFVREGIGASVAWRPADLPALSLRLGRANAYDATRQTSDVTGDEALLTATYQPAESLDLQYTLRWSRTTNHVTDVVSSDVANAAGATWATKYLGGRGNLYLGYNISARTADTRAPAGAAVELRQSPIAGLSVVEEFPATPLQVTLRPNAALVDGNTTASAGVNLGTAAGTGVIANRDLGAQFQDVVTPVSAIHVYVDQDQVLPQSLAALFTWEAYQSDDNARGEWTRVPLSGAVVYNPVWFRFEIPIERTAARFLKVVTKPLPQGATTDPLFREIFVTELQFFDVLPGEQARGRRSDVAGNLSGTTRLVLVRSLGLAYDFSGSLAHAADRRATWAIVNGLSLARRLSPVYAVGGRVERSDADSGRGVESSNRWSASLTADPLPTLGASLGYSGQLSEGEGGTNLSQSGTFSMHADPYEGIALGGTASASWARAETGAESRSLVGSVSASVIPNRILSFGGSFSLAATERSGGGEARFSDRRGMVEGSTSFSPIPALSMSGSVTRQFGGSGPPVTLWSFSGALSPFPGGDLQLRYFYTESYETAAQTRNRSHGPGARWNIRSGWYADAGYSIQETRAPASSTEVRTFGANLLITFR